MDYKKLLQDKTIQQVEDIADNWYCRLNRLKNKYGSPFGGIENRKAEKLIFELIRRVRVMGVAITAAMQTVPKYPEGGTPYGGIAIVGETGRELFVTPPHKNIINE